MGGGGLGWGFFLWGVYGSLEDGEWGLRVCESARMLSEGNPQD